MIDNDTSPSLHEVLARGIERGLRDVGADLTNCTPSTLTGHVIRELRAAGMHPGRYPHTAECRDDYCVHPIQCERDRICPPSPGGEVEQERLAWAAPRPTGEDTP